MNTDLTFEDKLRLLTGDGLWHTWNAGGKLAPVRLSDGPHGLRMQPSDKTQNNDSITATCFPLSCALAASWNTEAVSRTAAAIAEEAKSAGVGVLLGPGINIKRSPLCGRNFEYYSEDPLLAGKLAAAYIQAVQANGTGTSLKHFAANSQERYRLTSDSIVDIRALREIYLSAFEIAVKEAQPETIMASYNMLNGTYACENRWLLTDLLRKEWGFRGSVMSDWGACADLSACVRAGLDLEMPDSHGNHTKLLRKDCETDAELKEAVIQAAARLTALAEKHADAAAIQAGNDFALDAAMLEAHRALARHIAAECAVLLKNDGALPLTAGQVIAVAGPLAETLHYQGGGSSHINPPSVTTPVEALKAAGFTVIQVTGAASLKDADIGADTPLIFFSGLTDETEGEGFDRTTIELPDGQAQLFDELYAVHQNMVVVNFSGAPVSLPFAGKARAVLQMYLAGEAFQDALVDLLSGKKNPSGKLPETWPLSEKDTPCYGCFSEDTHDVQYRESIFTGYRYYDTFGIPVAWPFGYGLSYTTFEYSDLKITAQGQDPSVYEGGDMTVSVTVTNTGSAAGAETVQFYVENPECSYLRARRELRAFTKVYLEPGESRTVTVNLDSRAFSLYDEKSASFVMPSGTYAVSAAASIDDRRLTAAVTVHGTDYDRDDRTSLSAFFQRGKKLSVPEDQFISLYQQYTGKVPERVPATPGNYSVKSSLRELAEYSWIARAFTKVAGFALKKIAQGLPEGDPSVKMMTEMVFDGTIDSVANQATAILPYWLVEKMIHQANRGGKK